MYSCEKISTTSLFLFEHHEDIEKLKEHLKVRKKNTQHRYKHNIFYQKYNSLP